MKKIILVLAVAISLLQAEKVRVTESTAITKPYTEKVQVWEQCYEDTVEIDVACGQRDTNSIGIDTLIGAGLGIALGNQIGSGRGKAAAKVGGGLIGAYSANQMRDGGGNCKSYETITKCNPIYEYKTVNRTIGYNNCAYIDGERYCKRTKRPIKWLRYKKSITIY
ncbi:MAG: glycine zipper 2TM domain-containing protein [Sulfurimonas sp.]|nr:glycine zipper 2TM domain-containing protein [Sulfurimonas sp.]